MSKLRSNNVLILGFSALLSWWILDFFFGVFTGIDGLAFEAHKLCIHMVEDQGRLDSLNLKILCSYQAPSLDSDFEKRLSEVFIHLGLVHLLVASGTHLLIVQKFSRLLFGLVTKSKAPNYFFLLIVVLASNFCGPVTRSFAQVLIGDLSKKYSLGWTPVHVTLISSFIFLLFFPGMAFSISFWLSLSASLCLALLGKHLLLLSVGFFVALYPFIVDFGAPSVASILINIVITPVIAPLLILNSFLYVAIPNYAVLGDSAFIGLLTILKQFMIASEPTAETPFRINPKFKAIYGVLLVLLSLLFQKLKSKKLHNELHGRTSKNNSTEMHMPLENRSIVHGVEKLN